MTSRRDIDNSRLFSQAELDAWGGFIATYASLDRAIDADLIARDGISHVEFEVLLRLSRASDHRLRVQDLAANSLLTRSGTSRLIIRLEEAGLVDREPAPEDRRGSYVRLTPAGSERFAVAARRHVEFVRARFLSRLTESELRTLARIWRKVDATNNVE